MAVITKKDEKIADTVEQLEGSRSPDDFVAEFKELYPKDWAKIEKIIVTTNGKQSQVSHIQCPSQLST